MGDVQHGAVRNLETPGEPGEHVLPALLPWSGGLPDLLIKKACLSCLHSSAPARSGDADGGGARHAPHLPRPRARRHQPAAPGAQVGGRGKGAGGRAQEKGGRNGPVEPALALPKRQNQLPPQQQPPPLLRRAACRRWAPRPLRRPPRCECRPPPRGSRPTFTPQVCWRPVSHDSHAQSSLRPNQMCYLGGCACCLKIQ
jgi:hypothetical protein